MITCQCPAAAALPSVPNSQCAESFGQIQKIAFQRLKKADGTLNAFTVTTSDTGSIKKLASWEVFLSADDASKIVVSPFVYSPADQGGDARMSGGGNDDLGGVPDVLGANPVQFTGNFRAIPQAIAKALKQMECDANAGNLGVYLFDENGNIEAIQDEITATTFRPIPVRAFFVGDKIHGNYDSKDSNPVSWYYAENYSDNLAIVKPEFNPLVALSNAE